VLNLESLPLRIECFDVSNIQGEAIVASMTVFVDGKAKNAHYRTFSIRGLAGQDDVGAMREAVSRRFSRNRNGDLDESFSRMPNLVVVDGGKGQLAAALAVLGRSIFRGWQSSRWPSARRRCSFPAFRLRSRSTVRALRSSFCSGFATRRIGSR
jgi:excinuclease UvrABC nuclease subunit